MTEPASSEQLERIARLQARRASTRQSAQAAPAQTGSQPAPDTVTRHTSPTTRRRHPALGSRIAAAGLGATSMFAIVGLLGMRDQSAATADSAPIPTPEVVERPVKVVVHRVPASTTTVPVGSAATEPVEQASPIELTANTVVRTVTVTEAPRRRSTGNGSSSGGKAAPAAPAPKPTAKTRGSK